jgi:hypothetical protein
MKNITNSVSDNKPCYEIVADCHDILDRLDIEKLPDHPEGTRLVKRLELAAMRLSLGAEREAETLKRLRQLIDGIEGGNGEQH